MGNSHAAAVALEEGLRYQKAGLPEKALAQYRVARAEARDPAIVAEAWKHEAFVLHAIGQWEAALEAARESASLAREIGRDDLLAEAFNAEAAVHFGRGSYDLALPLYTSMLELARDARIRGLALQNMGTIHGRREELELAQRRFQEALEQFEAAGYDWGKAHVQNNLVAVALDRGDFERAEAAARTAISVARAVDDLDLTAAATLNLAEALAGLGRLEEAEEEASQALGQFSSSGNLWGRVSCFRTLGDVNELVGDATVAANFWRRGLELAREIGASFEAGQLEERLRS